MNDTVSEDVKRTLAERLRIAARDSRTFRLAMSGLGYEVRPNIKSTADLLDEAADALAATKPPLADVTVEAVHAANEEEKAAGWTLSLGYLDSVRNYVAHHTGYDATIEFVEACLLIGARELASMPGREEGADVEAAMRLMTSLGKTKLTWGELAGLAASRPKEDTHAE
jgi:hypothetical protein